MTRYILCLLLFFLLTSPPSANAGRRCTGSPYCTACTNCSRCAHCGAGGTCGVCAGYRSGASYNTTPAHSAKRGRKHHHTPEQERTEQRNNGNTLYGNSTTSGNEADPVTTNTSSYAYDRANNDTTGNDSQEKGSSGYWIIGVLVTIAAYRVGRQSRK